jgi:hypothetical protein
VREREREEEEEGRVKEDITASVLFDGFVFMIHS